LTNSTQRKEAKPATRAAVGPEGPYQGQKELGDVRWQEREYQELGEAGRHEDTIAFTIIGIFTPLSLAALVAAWQIPRLVLPLAVGSLSLYLYQQLVVARLTWFLRLRRERMRVLESENKVWHHRYIKARLDHGSLKPWSVPTGRWILFAFLFLAWILTIALALDVGKISNHLPAPLDPFASPASTSSPIPSQTPTTSPHVPSPKPT
jgi:hypothetical protein